MRQHITIEQLNQLSDKGKEKLREWWKPQEGDLIIISTWDNDQKPQILLSGFEPDYEYDYSNGINIKDSLVSDLALPLLSIGQMIQFLDEYDDYFRSWFQLGDGFDSDGKPKFKGSCNCRFIEWIYGSELCDTLWEAVKEILEQGDK